jgi:hypothetical protein
VTSSQSMQSFNKVFVVTMRIAVLDFRINRFANRTLEIRDIHEKRCPTQNSQLYLYKQFARNRPLTGERVHCSSRRQNNENTATEQRWINLWHSQKTATRCCYNCQWNWFATLHYHTDKHNRRLPFTTMPINKHIFTRAVACTRGNRKVNFKCTAT